MEFCIGVRCHHGTHDIGQNIRSEGGNDAQTDSTTQALPLIMSGTDEVIHLTQDDARALHHFRPLGRQKGATRRALEQGDAQLSFQLFDLGAEGGLGDKLLIGGGPECAGIGNRHEIPQLLECWPRHKYFLW